jgi:hypothetical protein
MSKSKVLETLNRFPSGKVLALIKKIGGPDVAEDILAGRKTIRLEEAARKLVDKRGRFIPYELSSRVVDADSTYHLYDPPTDCDDRFIQMAEAFNCGSQISLSDFRERTYKVILRVRKDAQLSNLERGTYLRILLPQVPETNDPGKVMEEVFLPALRKAYQQEYPTRNFIDYFKNKLVGQVSLFPGTRYDKLISAMSQGPVPAVYFPMALQGFSIPADREIMATLPEDVILSGGFDIAAAMVGYANVLARNANTPALDMAAWQWRSYSPCLSAHVDWLELNKSNLDATNTNGGCSGGVVILG